MHFAARLLPLAAASFALLGTAAEPALAADPACVPAAAAHDLKEVGTGAPAEAVPGEFVVRYRDAAGASRGVRRLAEAGAAGRRVTDRVALVRLPKGKRLRAAAAALRRDRDVVWAEPNYVYRAERAPNDALFAQQWSLHNTGRSGRADADIDAPEAWNVTTGDASVLVGVIDTGADLTHPDLAPNIAVNPGESGAGREANGIDDDGNGLADDVRGWDFAAMDNDPSDSFGHGSHVAGTIGARGGDGRGTTGVAWQVGLLPLRALNDQGSGSSLDIADAMTYAAGRGARVVNVSLGGAGYSQTMLDAICAAPDTLFVVAAGNSTNDVEQEPFYPCAYAAANIVCVAATDADDELASFSNFGAYSVDLAAPGAQILSTVPGGGHALYSGTSMATPHVAGAAALLFAQHPQWTPQQAKDALLGSVDRLPTLAGAVATGGRLNIARALAAEAGATAPVATTDAPATVGTTTATLAATVDAAGLSGTARFEYGPTPELGTATAAQALPTVGGPTQITQPVTALLPTTTYYARVVIVTPAGEAAGETVAFTTVSADVTATTGTAVAAGKGTARLRGTIAGAAAVSYSFEFGTSKRYGRATPKRRLAGGGPQTDVEAFATGLKPGVRYHYRLVVTGPNGTMRGADRTIVVASAALAVRRAKTSGRNLRVTVQVPGPGRVTVLATGSSAGGAVTLGRTTRAMRTAGRRTFVVRLSTGARRLQAAGKINVTVTFTASGARAAAGRSLRV
jgi:subtilisin family serine protease